MKDTFSKVAEAAGLAVKGAGLILADDNKGPSIELRL